jgi:hypothetical protein
MSEREGLTAHQQAILELSLETLVQNLELGFDIESIEQTPGGGYSIRPGKVKVRPPGVPVCSECDQAPCTGPTLCYGDKINYGGRRTP